MAGRGATVTLLFSDLVDSTMLLERVGDVRGQRIFSAHHALLSEAVAEHSGDEVKWLGDGLMVAFGSTADAVRCALAMQRAARQPIEGERLPIRVGLHVGEALVEEADWFGMPVVIARRLCDRAVGGQVLCTDVVRGVLVGHHEFAFAPAGELALKGLRDPVAAFAVAAESDEPGRALTRTPFVGRRDALTQLDAALTRAIAGTGSLMLVSGEPGIGKSRLLEEFGVAATNEAVVLGGQCYEGESGLPYSPFAEALDQYVAETDADIVKAEFGRNAAVLARLSPAVAALADEANLPAPIAIPPDEERLRLFDSVLQLLVSIGERSPVVLVLDDLHWADHATVALLRYVTRTLKSSPLLVLGAYRDVELDRRHPLAEALAALRRQIEPERIKLEGLESKEVQQLLSMIAERDVPAEFADALLAETEGNPFFVREVILNLIEEGKLTRTDGRWTTTVSVRALGIPEGVREVIGRRLSRLSDDANRLLSTASAFEGPFRFDCVVDVTGLDESAGLDALDEALDYQLVRQATVLDEYEFTHALIRHTLFSELNPSRQVRLHRQLAETLEQLAPDASAQIAHHYQQSAALPGADRGVNHAVAAAEIALGTHSFDEAAAFFGLAVELLQEGDHRRGRILARQALAAAYGSDPAAAEALALEAADLLLDAEGREAAVEFLDRAAGSLGDVGMERASWRIAKRGRPLTTEDDGMMWWRFELLSAFEQSAESGLASFNYDPRSVAKILELASHVPAGELRIFVPFPDRNTALALGGDDPVLQLVFIGDFRRGRELGERRAEELAAEGRVGGLATVWTTVGRCHTALGDLELASELIQRARPYAERLVGPSPAFLNYLAARDEFRMAVDSDWEAAMNDIAPLLAEPAPENAWAMAPANAASARTFVRLGIVDVAMRTFETTLPALEEAQGYAPNYARLACDLATTLWWAERTDHLDVVERNIREKVVAPDFRYPMMDGRLSLARLCALTDRLNEAREWFAAARTVLDEQGARTLRAICDFDEATVFRSPDLAEAALAAFRAIGMTGWIFRGEALLDSL